MSSYEPVVGDMSSFHQRSGRDWPTSRWLPQYSDLGNLVALSNLLHTRFTYHRTWETGLETEIRVADFSPAFFCPPDSP